MCKQWKILCCKQALSGKTYIFAELPAPSHVFSILFLQSIQKQSWKSLHSPSWDYLGWRLLLKSVKSAYSQFQISITSHFCWKPYIFKLQSYMLWTSVFSGESQLECILHTGLIWGTVLSVNKNAILFSE